MTTLKDIVKQLLRVRSTCRWLVPLLGLAGLPAAAMSQVVISQIYGGGNLSGATYRDDYVELFNRSCVPVDISTWSIQQASSSGVTWARTNLPPGTVLQPGQYFLMQFTRYGTGTANGASLPVVPDAYAAASGTTGISLIDMSGTTGKIALVRNQTTLPSATCPNSTFGNGVVDMVTYGGGSGSACEGTVVGTVTSAQSVVRNLAGCADTNVNSADFTVQVASLTPPRNMATALAPCGGSGTAGYGACNDAATGLCSVLTAADCATAGGNYSECTPCDSRGACCTGNGICTITFPAECAVALGTFSGGGTTCYSPTVGTNAIETITSPTTGPTGDDVASSTITLPFTFVYYGQNKTQVWYNTNGLVGFGSSPSTAFADIRFPNTATPNDVLAALWDDFNVDASASTQHGVNGTSPNRRFVITWNNVLDRTLGGGRYTFQVILHENTNQIEFRYGTYSPEIIGGDFSSGIENSTGTVGQYRLSRDITSNSSVTWSPDACPLNTGACCVVSSCSIGSAVECTNLGGGYQGDSVSCSPDPCVTGACCLPNGACTDAQTAGQCTLNGGVWQGIASTCDAVTCPPTGSCCIGSACSITFESLCTGDWVSGGVCAPNPCVGACCNITTGVCSLVVPSACVSPDLFQGAGTVCTPTNPCVGRCCFADGSCTIVTPSVCTTAGGMPGAGGTTCGTITYSAATQSNPIADDISSSGTAYTPGGGGGSTSLDDGSQLGVALGFTFSYFGANQTTINIGTNGFLSFAAAGITDNSPNSPIVNTATPNSTIAPYWADLLLTSGNQIRYQTLGVAPYRRFIVQWTAVGHYVSGSPQGAATFQAILYESSNAVEFRYGTINLGTFAGTRSIGIEDAAGTSGVNISPLPTGGPTSYLFSGSGFECPQPTGACCSGVGGTTCSVGTYADCQALGGAYQTNGTTCTPNPCATGACCLPNGSCTTTFQVSCAAADGLYQGDGTTCPPSPECPAIGSCCVGTVCSVTFESQCTGSWTSGGVCTPTNPCTGACCSPAGVCTLTDAAGCAGADQTFGGLGTTCTPTPCLTGACCSGASCSVLTAAGCAAASGTYTGDGTTCGGGYLAPIVGTTPVEDISTSAGATQLSLGDDNSSSVIPLPFSFRSFGAPRTQFFVNSNGWLGFDVSTSVTGAQMRTTVVPLGSGVNPPNEFIAAYWRDLNQTGAAAKISYETRGTAPTRRFIVQWTAIPRFGQSDANTFQIVLYEGADCVSIRYGTFTAATVNGDFGAGLENLSGTAGVNIAATSIAQNSSYLICPTDNPCNPLYATGACCVGTVCTIGTQAACLAADGAYQGDATTCTPNPCTPPGACCAADGLCSFITAGACSAGGGFFFGEGTLCSPTPCPTGACCLTSGACVIDIEADCTAQGGFRWTGAGSCTPNMCVGRCCANDGTCTITTSGDCAGRYGGDGTTCDGPPSGSPQTFTASSPDVPVVIPDNSPTGVDSSITVGPSFNIGKVTVFVDITHTYIGDLKIKLTHGATSVTLFSQQCGTQEDLTATFDDAGPLAQACTYPQGTIRPATFGGGSLAAFDGLDSAGVWTLNVSDNANLDTGNLVAWSAILDPAISPCQGACCVAGTCQVLTFDDCTAITGNYKGDGTVCAGRPAPMAPTGVTADQLSYCISAVPANLTLSASCESGDTIQWFTDSCGGTAIGAGSPLVISAPAASATYYARCLSDCGEVSACSTVDITVLPLPTAPSSANSDVTSYCSDAAPATITLSATDGSGMTLHWYADSCGGTSIGTGSPLMIAAPAVTTTYHAQWTSPCGASTCATTTVTVTAAPTADAGSAADTCGQDAVSLSGSGANAASYLWTGGAGTFADASNPMTTYTPGANESGPVMLTLTATGNAPCTTASDTVTFNVVPAPTALAGSSLTISGCTAVPVALSGSVSNAASSMWSTSGTGTFADPASPATTYTISPADVAAGAVTLTLTAQPNAPCATPAVSSLTLTVLPPLTTAYVDDDYIGLPDGTEVTYPAVGGSGSYIIGCNAFASIQAALNAVTGSTVNVAPGTYDTDLLISLDNTNLVGSGASVTTIRGVFGGDNATIRVAASNVTISGLTITRLGNNTTDWNDPTLNSAGVAVQGQAVAGLTLHDCLLTGNRSAIDINNSNGHTIHNCVIDNNHTGVIFRNQTDNITFTENAVTNNRTVGVLFLDASGGTNVPVQTAANCTFTDNTVSGNWYGQIVDRQAGGSLPAPGTTNLKNFSGNWLGTVTPVITTANSAEPPYSTLIPVAYGGTATPPGGQPDVAGAASDNFDITPMLASGTDTDISTGFGSYGFQGDYSALAVTSRIAQTGSTGRVQEGHDAASDGGTISVDAGTFADNVVITKRVTIDGAGSGDCASGADPLTQTVLTAASTGLPVVTISDVGGASTSSRLTLRDLRVTGSTAAGIHLTSTAVRSFFLFDNIAVADNGGAGLEFTGASGFADAQVLDSSFCSNNVGIRTATSVASLDGLSIDGCEIRNSIFNGLGMYGNTGSGFNPTNISVANSQFSANGTSSNLFQGSGDLSFFEFNGNVSISNVAIATTGRVPVQFRGRGSDGAPGTWLPAGTVTINGLTVTGTADRPAMYIQIYSDVSGITLNDVDLTGISNSGPPNTAFSVAGMILDHTGAAPLELGNTAFPCPGGGYASLAVYNTGGAHASCSTSFAGASTGAAKEVCVVDADDPFGLPGQVVFDDAIVLSPPTGGSVCTGGMYTFTVSVSGLGPISYQWRHDGNPVGTDSNSYTITNAAAMDAGGYTVDITNPCGTISTGSVSLGVLPLPVAPTSVTTSVSSICAGDVGSVTLTAVGGSGDTLQWFDDSCGGNLIGTGNPLVIAYPAATTTYHARWTNTCGDSGCASASVSVSTPPVSPASAAADVTSYCADAVPATISLTASGGSGDTLAWYADSCGGTPVGTGSPLVIAAPGATTTYYARWETAPCTPSMCASVTVTVNPIPVAPTIASSDVTAYCDDAAPAAITLTASGGSGDTLEWFSGSCGGTPVGTGSPLVIAAPATTTTYHVRWTNGCGSSTCANVTVTVQAAPTAGAGGPYSVTGQTPVAISGSASNYASVMWSTTGTGLFANAASLSTTYTPSAADETAGTVTLTLTANPTAPCGTAATSNVVLSITPCVTGAVVYVDDNYTGLPFGTAVNWPDNGAAGPHIVGCDAFATIQGGVTAVVAPGTVNVAAGLYQEDVLVNKTVALLGAGAGASVIEGVVGGDNATVRVSGNSIEVAGFTITRFGNTVADWNDPTLNSAGVAVQGQAVAGLTLHDCLLTGNRSAIDINNSNGHTIRNCVIDNNHTGVIFRNQTDNITFTENAVTNNRTVGVLFLDASGGSNVPVQTAANCAFTDNSISGNWYGQIVDRQAGGSLPAPGTTNLKNFSGNWLGTVTPVITTANSAEPPYSTLIPVAYGGTATPPGGQPDVAGPASDNFDITPMLASGTDTDISTGSGSYGFQGDYSALAVTSRIAQTGSIGRVQEGHDRVDEGGVVAVSSGLFSESTVITKRLAISGAGSGACADATDPLTQTVLSAGSGSAPVVLISDVGGLSAGDRLSLSGLRITGAGPAQAGIQVTASALRSFYTFDDVALVANGGSGLEFVGAGSFADIQVTNSSLCGNYQGIRTATSLAGLDGLSIDGCEIRNSVFNGLGMYGNTGSGFNPTNISVANSQFSANGTSSNLFQGSGDLSFFEFNGNVSISNVAIATTGRVPVQFRGRGTDGAPGTWLPAGTVTINGLTVTGTADRPAMYIQIYSDVSGITLNNVDLTGVTSSAAPNTAFAVAGMILDHTGAAPLELGNTAFPCPGGGYASLAVYNTGGAHASCSTSFAGATTLAQKESCVVDADDPFGLPGQVSFDDVDIIAPITGGGVCAGGMYTFTVGATGAGPLSYQWYNGITPVGTDSNTYEITNATLADAGSYTVVVTNACGPVTSNAAVLNVYPNPAPPSSVGSDVTSFCTGSAPANITLTASGGSGDTLAWYADSCGGTPVGTGSPLVIAAPAMTTTYHARWESTNCGVSGCASVTVTVNASPVAPTSAASDVTSYCSAGAPGTITLTASGGSGDTLEWFSDSCGGTSVGTGSPLVIAAPATTTTYHARWTTALCGSSSCASVTVTVNASPVDPTGASSDVTSYCAAATPATITLTASGGSGDTLAWYAGSCDGTPIGTGSPLVIAAPATTTTYHARWTTVLCGDSACASVTVTVNANPAAPVGLNASPATICDGGPVTLTASVGVGETVDWFDNASCGGAPLGSGSPFNTSVSGTTSFYARARNLTTGCTSACIGPVTTSVYPSPIAPTSAGASSSSFCAGSLGTITLTASGGSGDTLAWYSGSCGGTPIGTGSPLVIAAPGVTTTYHARWESVNCGDSSCASVMVNVQAAPVVSAGGPYIICADGVAALMGSANNAASVMWTSTGTGSFLDPASPTTVYMPSPADVSAGSVVLTLTAQAIAPCSGTVSSMATLTIQPLPVAATGASVSDTNFCAGSVANITLSATGGSGAKLAWYKDACGGSQIGSGTPLTIPAPTTTTTYYARWINPCGSSTCVSVAVTVYQNPVAPSSISLSQDTWCDGSGPASITLGAVGGSGDTFEWFTGSCGGTLIGTGTSLVIPAPSATTIYYGRWNTDHCGASTCAQATVTVNPLPVAPTSASVDAPEYCEDSEPASITLTAAGGSGDTLKWYTGSCGGTLVGAGSPLVIAAPITTTTYHARWETTSCGASTCASVTVTVNPLPVAPTTLTSSADNYCSTSVANITLTALGGSGDTLEWFDDACGGNQIGTGTPLVITAPLASTTYYARWSNVCGSSDCAEVTVTVTPAVGACCSGYGLGKMCQVVSPDMCNPTPTPNGAYRGNCTVCMPLSCCPADYNNNGIVSVQDIFDYLADFFAGSFNTDFNNNAFISVQDLFDFLAAYFAGC